MLPSALEVRPPATDIEASELDLRAYVHVLVRRRWVALGALLATLAVGVLLTIRAPRIYQAQATLVIEPSAPEVLTNVREVYDSAPGGWWAAKEYYETQYSVLKSRPVSQKAAAQMGLVPAVLIDQVRAAGPTPLEARATADPLTGLPRELQAKLKLMGLDGVSDREQLIHTLQTIDIAEVISGQVDIQPVKDSRLVLVVVEGTDPERAATVANAVSDSYIEYNLDEKVRVTRSAVDWLSDQMSELKDKLNNSELALHEFKKGNNIVSVSMEDRQTMISQTLGQLNASLSAERAKRLDLESRRDRVRAAHESGSGLDVLNEVMTNPLVQRLKSMHSDLKQQEQDLSLRYTGEHPAVIAVRQKLELAERELASEIDKILRSLDNEYRAARDTEARLEREIERVKAEALELNKKEIDYSRFKRERDNNQALYELVLKRQKEADLTQLLKVNNIRKLEAAKVPEFPIRPRVDLNLLLSLLIGMVLSVGLAFMVDYLDNTVKSQAHVERILGLPFLGIIPSIKGDKGAKMLDVPERDHYIIAHPRSNVAESCRTIRTNLMFMSPEQPAKLLLVTSSGPREGKSTTTINLAMTMALGGARTVVVDTDMRRPRLHHSFGLSNDAGISNVILGERRLEDVVIPTAVDKLKVLTCGPIPPNPSELLHTDAFAQIVRDLSGRFDRVLFDSPPVSAVTDALVLSSMCDGVVLVIEASKTSWQMALQSKKRLESVGARIFGVVLNNVDLEDKRYGGYYQYYYAYYRKGYGYGEDDSKKVTGS